jgi:putative flippase GtrA
MVDWRKILRFLIVGARGFIIHYGVTVLFTELFFGTQNYFYAYILGMVLSLTHNFYYFTASVFEQNRSQEAILKYLAFALAMNTAQAFTVREAVAWLGHTLYWLVIPVLITVFASTSYVVYNEFIFTKP